MQHDSLSAVSSNSGHATVHPRQRPQLPAWVRERMKGGGAGRNLSELIEELRGRIQANAAKPGQEKLSASASR